MYLTNKKYNSQLLIEIFKKAFTITLINLIFSSVIALGLGISPKYSFIVVIIGCIYALLYKKENIFFAPTLILISFLHPLIARYGIEGIIIITFCSSIITFGFAYLKITKYFIVFPRSIFISITTISSLFIFLIALKYLLGLKININYEYYYLNVISLYKNLRFTNWLEALLGIFTIIAYLFFEKFELKSCSYIFSFLISMIFSYCLTSQGYKIASISNNLGYIMTDSTISLNFDNAIPILSNIKVGLNAFKNIKLNEFPSYIMDSLIIAIVLIFETVITTEICSTKSGIVKNSDKIIKKLSYINTILAFTGNFIASTPLFRNYSINHITHNMKWINLIQMSIVIFLIKFGYNILNYVPMSGLAAILIILSWKISNIDKFIWFLRSGTKVDQIIIYLIIFFCITQNVVEALKLGLIIGMGCILYRFSFLQLEAYFIENEKMENANLENKIKDSITYKIKEAGFLGIISDSSTNILEKENYQDNLIIDITNIREFDHESVCSLESVILSQIKNFKEIIVYCNDLVIDKIKSELKIPVRIISSSSNIKE